MKLSDIRKAYEDLSGSLSKYNRQLAFAGIGIIWLFRTTEANGSTSIDPEMLNPIFCLVISFAFDILQYLWLSLYWYVYYLYKYEKGSTEDEEMSEPEWPNMIAWGMFTIKVSAMMSAYINLGLYLYPRLF